MSIVKKKSTVTPLALGRVSPFAHDKMWIRGLQFTRLPISHRKRAEDIQDQCMEIRSGHMDCNDYNRIVTYKEVKKDPKGAMRHIVTMHAMTGYSIAGRVEKYSRILGLAFKWFMAECQGTPWPKIPLENRVKPRVPRKKVGARMHYRNAPSGPHTACGEHSAWVGGRVTRIRRDVTCLRCLGTVLYARGWGGRR